MRLKMFYLPIKATHTDRTYRIEHTEIAEGLHDGKNVLTGEAVEVNDSTVVGPRKALVVEYKRKK